MADPDCPRRLDLRVRSIHYLAFGYVPDGMCLLAGVHKLPQGHALACDLQTGAVRIWRYWSCLTPTMSRSTPKRSSTSSTGCCSTRSGCG